MRPPEEADTVTYRYIKLRKVYVRAPVPASADFPGNAPPPKADAAMIVKTFFLA
jgi:hypothetical protein